MPKSDAFPASAVAVLPASAAAAGPPVRPKTFSELPLSDFGGGFFDRLESDGFFDSRWRADAEREAGHSAAMRGGFFDDEFAPQPASAFAGAAAAAAAVSTLVPMASQPPPPSVKTESSPEAAQRSSSASAATALWQAPDAYSSRTPAWTPSAAPTTGSTRDVSASFPPRPSLLRSSSFLGKDEGFSRLSADLFAESGDPAASLMDVAPDLPAIPADMVDFYEPQGADLLEARLTEDGFPQLPSPPAPAQLSPALAMARPAPFGDEAASWLYGEGKSFQSPQPQSELNADSPQWPVALKHEAPASPQSVHTEGSALPDLGTLRLAGDAGSAALANEARVFTPTHVLRRRHGKRDEQAGQAANQSPFSASPMPPPSSSSSAANGTALIGAYTRAERDAKIARYRAKRSQRSLNRTAYACRHNFAVARPRIGGRFVKIDARTAMQLKKQFTHTKVRD